MGPERENSSRSENDGFTREHSGGTTSLVEIQVVPGLAMARGVAVVTFQEEQD